VDVFADTGRGGRLEVRPSSARVWLASVTPARLSAPPPALPEALPDSLPPPEDSPPALAVDPGLKPPVLRAPGTLALPPGWSGPRASVELDVRVDESGRVSDALRAAGNPDSVLLDAARRCALGMRFYPALQAGRPVPVWCRQRFDFGGARR
jgi:outer membrane biosynthesis protein TonB